MGNDCGRQTPDAQHGTDLRRGSRVFVEFRRTASGMAEDVDEDPISIAQEQARSGTCEHHTDGNFHPGRSIGRIE